MTRVRCNRCARIENEFFITSLSIIHEQVEFSMNLSRNLSLVKSIERQQRVQQEHRAVLEAIRRRAASGAPQAMREHLETAMARMLGA